VVEARDRNAGFRLKSEPIHRFMLLHAEDVMFDDKVVLITGGTGSFGNAVLRRFLDTGVREIRVFSRDEKKQEDMRLALGSPRVKFYIGDVREYSGVADAMRGVDYVFHAAALKQVPSCEFYPLEAIRTNVLGAENVMNASLAYRVQRVVLLSTDKAVYPVNAMGLSKALMEKAMVAKTRHLGPTDTVFVATRYGNVMASRGSVIPLFVSQLKAGRPLTITDPEMTRFLMSLDESVELVLHAFKEGQQGDIFVQRAPASTMRDLAAALQMVFQRETGVQLIGTRHGEKLYETLVSREEMVRASLQDRYFRIPADARDLNYGKYFSEGQTELAEQDDYNSHNTQRLSVKEVAEVLRALPFVQEQLNA
jgi:UDP-glucose 4-epimerase